MLVAGGTAAVDNRQSVVHPLLGCWKWGRERDATLVKIRYEKFGLSCRHDNQDLQALFGESLMEMVLQFLKSTTVGKRREAEA